MSAKRKNIDDFEVRWKHEFLGWTQQEIADYYGVSRTTIHFKLHPEKKKENNEYSKKWRLEHPEYDSEYYLKNYGKINEYNKQWQLENPEHMKEIKDKWQQENPEYNKEYSKVYYDNNKELLLEQSKEWWQSDKGKEAKRRVNAERRELGSIELNKSFPGSEGHHIDTEHIIHMPAELHRSIYHNQKTCQGMEDINAIAFGYITEDTFDKLIAGEI